MIHSTYLYRYIASTTKALLLLLSIAVATPSAAQKGRIEILQTNDTHSTIEPLSPFLSDTIYAGRGGYLRRAAFIDEERKANPDLLLFDSGDFSQGSPYYTIYKGDIEIELMNRMHYDAATIGNHEFDFGVENMARIFAKATFPIVCSNYDFKGTACEPYVKPYIVIERAGLRIGVIGLGCPLEGMVDSKNCVGVDYLDPVATVNYYTHVLRQEEKVDLIVCLSHLGLTGEVSDQTVFPQTQDVDIILGGHSHTLIKELEYINDCNDKAVPDTQNGKHACFVSRLWVDVK